MSLTDTFLRSVKTTGKAQKHSDGHGLYLYVSPAGGKLWRMNYRFEDKQKTLLVKLKNEINQSRGRSIRGVDFHLRQLETAGGAL